MQYTADWESTKKRFGEWWKGQLRQGPLMWIVATRDIPLPGNEPEPPFQSLEEYFIGPEARSVRLRNQCRKMIYLADAFPSLTLNIGPGSMSTYLGSEPVFSPQTVWYTECIHDWADWKGMAYDPENKWWKRHLEVLRQARDIAGEDYPVDIPDIIENVDILSAMLGPQNLLFDLMDHPDVIKAFVERIDDLYFEYYDRIYEVVKDRSGGCSYTAFRICGPGRTAKVQCDFSAMISPDQFRTFVQPSLQKQCARLDATLYHLDGPDAVRHLDALMEIPELSALQYTPGAGNPPACSKEFDFIHDRVKAAGKSLWISVGGKDYEAWVQSADRLVQRYGTESLYLLFPVMSETQAETLLNKAEREWR
ncbi:MAG TPA: trimethylamine corrinoid protein 2 [Clostridiales bacterium]|nr:trimethylamine corrinoid protein 2 [Clostridiales bacterium]